MSRYSPRRTTTRTDLETVAAVRLPDSLKVGRATGDPWAGQTPTVGELQGERGKPARRPLVAMPVGHNRPVGPLGPYGDHRLAGVALDVFSTACLSRIPRCVATDCEPA